MKLSEERQIAAPPEKVWEALLDPDILRQCVPGCESMTGNPSEGFEAVVTQKVGPVKATFKGQVKLQDIVEGQSLKLVGEGKGGAAGFAKGGATVRLEPQDGGTRLIYDAEASVGGKLAQLGSRIIDSFTKRLADQFFQRFQETVEAGQVASAAPVEASSTATAATANATPAEQETAKKKGLLGRIFG
ncbi:carbon monoxide dehydrogenase [Silicimonas algicola]|uniref:Carbon monoxide dehydrogenase subunit G n=1 Tax=Silicimonas algicola TaxID=1826607 RepID=A0A316GEL8_9RHOB|nr:carbon monoxide dehydrogenase subunit G [Silicimonas algicola]AZQ66661.1 carbon monoxide dehydrogenase [Silicimonas algicola]PWK59013.1 hypothetical protein C8D95_101834 [Silicimonas algicola]